MSRIPENTPAEQGTVYLLHFDHAHKHAKHYLGWTSLEVQDRLARHRDGRGARLLQVILARGNNFRLVRTWHGPQSLERKLKDRHNSGKLCPICKAVAS